MLADPRVFPSPGEADAPSRALHELAARSLGAATGVRAESCDADIAARLHAMVERRDGAALERALASSPSAAIHRHLWRALDAALDVAQSSALGPVLFALPVVIVAASDDADEHAIDAIVENPAELAAILAEHGALGGHRQFALSGALCAAQAIDVRALPALLHASTRADDGAVRAPLDLAPSPLVALPGAERVHLRFLVGSALASRPSALWREASVGAWGVPLTRALSRALAVRGASLVAMPRAPQSLVAAVASGRAVQREASAALFASDAIRRLRGTVGEPVAVISAHRVPGVPAGGEVRLSLSSVLEPRDAQGFRCPLSPLDTVAGVVAMLEQLVRDCRVADVRFVAGVHPDRDPATGVTLLFKPDTVPPGAAMPVH
jgi:hypothetical protein